MRKNLRILICAAYAIPYSGGYAVNVFELARRLVERGIDVTILSCNTENALDYEVVSGVRIYRLPCWHILGKTYPIPKPSKLLLKVITQPYDLVHTQTRFFITSLLGVMLAKMRRIALVHTERGTRHAALSCKPIEMVSQTYDHTLGALLVKSAQVSTGVSLVACGFTKHLGAKEVTLVHNGINVYEIRQRSNSTRSRIVITYVGRLIWGKGVQDLIQAFSDVLNTHDTELVIVGCGNYEGKLRELVASLELDSRVSFRGECPHNEISDILRESDLFVNPSYSEGLPTSVMEAMALGLPVVATDVGGTRELIDNGHNGYLVAPQDTKKLAETIRVALSNDSNMGSNARRTMQDLFSWDTIVDKMLSVYMKALDYAG